MEKYFEKLSPFFSNEKSYLESFILDPKLPLPVCYKCPAKINAPIREDAVTINLAAYGGIENFRGLPDNRAPIIIKMVYLRGWEK